MADQKPVRRYKTIIREINENDLNECTLDEGYNHKASFSSLSHMEDVTPATNPKTSYPLRLNRDQKTTIALYGTPQISRKTPFPTSNIQRLYSPGSKDRRNPLNVPLNTCLSRSETDISTQFLNQKLTNDSGTGDSLIVPVEQAYTTTANYEKVHVVGQKCTVLIKNRYEYDRTKVEEYLRRKDEYKKYDTPSNNNGRWTIFKIFRKPSRSSIDVNACEMVVRHHT